MIITTNRIASVTEANQNFNKVAQIANKLGDAVIFRRNKAAYVLFDVETMGEEFIKEYEKLKMKHLSEKLLREYNEAYQTLAK